METFGDTFTSKNIQKFNCNICYFKCSKIGDWKRHVMTPKHQNNTLANKIGDAGDEFYIELKYRCDICNKNYNSRNGLWKHKNKCLEKSICDDNILHQEEKTDQNDKDKLILILIKQNAELIKEHSSIRQMVMEQQTMVLEIAKNGTHNTNTTHTNSHNNSFNLQFFLNETCKDAMNITDFVESIKLQLSDLERVGEIGYIEGISSIITKNLNALDVTKRPIHCTDKKRETMYIKDEDKWEKEDDEKKKLRKVIKKVADKNARLILNFRERYPDYKNSSSRISDQYNKIIIESMGGPGDNDLEKEDKIIRNITKATTIDKN